MAEEPWLAHTTFVETRIVDQKRKQIVGVIKKIARAIDDGLNLNDEGVVLALAREIESDLTKSTMVIRGWKAVSELVGKSRSQLWRDICAGRFPSPFDAYGDNSVAWLRTEVEEWITSRPRRHYGAGSPTQHHNDANSSPALPRRRGHPRKDAKRSTDESADDGITKNRVVIIKNRVVYVGHWDRCARRAA